MAQNLPTAYGLKHDDDFQSNFKFIVYIYFCYHKSTTTLSHIRSTLGRRITFQRGLRCNNWRKYTYRKNAESTRLESKDFAGQKRVDTNCVRRKGLRPNFIQINDK